MSQKSARGSTSPSPEASNTPAKTDTPILTPTSTSPNTPHRGRSGSASPEVTTVLGNASMDKDNVEEQAKEEVDVSQKEEEKKEKEPNGGVSAKAEPESEKSSETAVASGKQKNKKKTATTKCKKHEEKNKKKKKTSKSAKPSSSKHAASPSSDSDSDASAESESDADSDSSASDSDDSSSEEEKLKKKRKARAKQKAAQKKKKEKAKGKAKKSKKSKKQESSSDSSDSSDADSDVSDAESESSVSSVDERPTRRRRSTTKSRTVTYETSTEAEDTGNDTSLEQEAETAASLQEQLNQLHLTIQAKQVRAAQRARAARVVERSEPVVVVERSRSRRRSKKDKKDKKEKEKEKEAEKAKDSKKKGKKASTLEFKRVDQLYDSTIHDFKLQESAEAQEDQFDEFVFTVRRCFNWENKYRNTVVDIKSKLLREALQTIMKDVKGVSLVEEQPCVDPNMLFLYLEETRTYYKKTLKSMIKKQKKRKEVKRLTLMRQHVKVLIGYLDEDYAETKKTLYPLLEAGNITFELLWALFKPNTLAYTTTYGSVNDPRCFKVDYAYKEQSFIRGEWYSIEGRYLEYDGKHFGLGDFHMDVESFKGPRKITSLSTYPLQYHKESDKIKEQLIERGKKFVMMQGMNYRFHKGLAFVKKKKAVAKVNINGRVMVDPAIFRRINPNYPISVIKPKESGDIFSDDDESDCGCGGSSSDEDNAGGNVLSKDDDKQRMAWRIIWDKNDKAHLVQVPVDENGDMIKPEKLETLPDGESKDKAKTPQVFTEEELMITSPVVLGFSFKEKLWLEFSLSGIKDIEWDEGAFDSLVLPANHKNIVKALVSSHKFHAAETIDDVVQGKGKGLVFVLHGTPGVGKTLTAEGIADMLRCPLYAVSAGELGVDMRNVEHELQRIMDIAHSWGAVLLLDEADVFLERRETHDIARNALVSIFLRLLEYFQGILFLTTNRVETFDPAFQSRIHVSLKYEALGQQAKKKIWKQFIKMAQDMEGKEALTFTDRDYETLARNDMNGRQIKHAVRTAQSLAVNEKEKLSMEHIKKVLQLQQDFNGLTNDAMKAYI